MQFNTQNHKTSANIYMYKPECVTIIFCTPPSNSNVLANFELYLGMSIIILPSFRLMKYGVAPKEPVKNYKEIFIYVYIYK
jgi:hypothetical protein